MKTPETVEWSDVERRPDRCRLCSAPLAPVRGLSFEDLAVLCCGQCALVHLHRTSEPPDYGARALGAFRGDPAEFLAAHHYGILDQLERILGPARGNRRLLDIGCSFGAVVHEARRRGWDAHGLDTFRDAVRAGSPHTGGLVIAEVPGIPFRPGSFDAVTMWHVLEHVADPVGVLREVAASLRPGGIVFIEVPNLGSPLAWLVYRRRWLGFETPGHRFAFTRDTLIPLVRGAGLRPIEVSRPVIAGLFPGGIKGAVRAVLFRALAALDQGDGLRIAAIKS